MSISDLIYAHLPCPLCGEDTLPLQAWICPSDFDEDGHANGFEICELRCPSCGTVEYQTDEQEEKGARVIAEIEDALWEGKTFPIGTIHSYYPGLAGDGNGMHQPQQAEKAI